MNNNERWSYQVVDIPPKFLGSNIDEVQEKLNEMGSKGWELVSVLKTGPGEPIRTFFKRKA